MDGITGRQDTGEDLVNMDEQTIFLEDLQELETVEYAHELTEIEVMELAEA